MRRPAVPPISKRLSYGEDYGTKAGDVALGGFGVEGVGGRIFGDSAGIVQQLQVFGGERVAAREVGPVTAEDFSKENPMNSQWSD